MADAERLNLEDFSLGVLNVAEEADGFLTLNSHGHSTDRAFLHAKRELEAYLDEGGDPGIEIGFSIADDAFGSDGLRLTMVEIYGSGYLRQINGSTYYRFDRVHYATPEEFHERKRIPGSIQTYRRLVPGFLASLYELEVVPAKPAELEPADRP